MADFAFNASAALTGGGSTSYDGAHYSVELSELPRSRAPSYISTKSSVFQTDDDEEALIKHVRSTSHPAPSKSDSSQAVRVVSQTPTVRAKRDKRRKLQGWRFGVAVAAWVAFFCLMLNLLFTISASIKFRKSMVDGVGTAYEGSCDVVDTWATWTHILINALSSVLLSASNYTMQCLSSPTRKEIDRAHSKGDWVDIGVASVRNIFGRISWRRTGLWFLLSLSSIPIHLLYNSAIFKTLDANIYDALVVDPDFLKGQPFSTNATYYEYGYSTLSDYYYMYPELRNVQAIFSNNSAHTNTSLVQNLTSSECITAYGTDYVTGRNHVLLVTNQNGPNKTEFDSFLSSLAGPDSLSGTISYGWICEDLANNDDGTNCDIPTAQRNATNWTLGGYKIDYCLSQIEPPHCKLQFSTFILTAVILMNAFKSAIMFWTLWRQKEPTLVTCGDAISSFLETPDVLTRGRCLTSKRDVLKGPLKWKLKGPNNKPSILPLPQTFYASVRRRWFAAASLKRWCFTLGLCIGALITACVLLALGVAQLGFYLGGSSPFSLGFGKVDSRAVINASLPQGSSSGLVCAVLLANLPQAICSFLYLAYNGLFTSMLLAAEWSRYFLRPKALRVTTPHGGQRSTYYLHLPYIYSIPLLVASSMLHWLISESIFLARITAWRNGQPFPEADSSEVGYSCLPILLVILLGFTMLLTSLGFGFRKFHSHMPVAGSCSVAIAAACHRPKDDLDAAVLPVSWGEVNREGTEDVGHCCFTTEDVHDLIVGRMYAGQNEDYWEGSNAGGTSGIRQRRVIM